MGERWATMANDDGRWAVCGDEICDATWCRRVLVRRPLAAMRDVCRRWVVIVDLGGGAAIGGVRLLVRQCWCNSDDGG